jgi:hypothetical protein
MITPNVHLAGALAGSPVFPFCVPDRSDAAQGSDMVEIPKVAVLPFVRV